MLRKSTLAAATVAVALAGCTTRLGDFTLATTKNVDLARMGEYQRSGTRATGADSRSIILFIPTGQPSAEEAADRAIESVPGGVALEDVVVTSTWWWIPYIYGKSTLEVEGTVLIDPRQAK